MTDKGASRRKMLAQEYVEFKEQYYAERKRAGSEWVDARMLLNTGLILSELERERYVERQGTLFRPLR